MTRMVDLPITYNGNDDDDGDGMMMMATMRCVYLASKPMIPQSTQSAALQAAMICSFAALMSSRDMCKSIAL